jgi:hypothetical protein
MADSRGKRFDHSLSPDFRAKLIAAAASGWWRDVLDDETLIVALRGGYLNVYWKGQSIFKVEPGTVGLEATTHEKYLLDPGLSRQVRFDGKAFDVGELERKAFLRVYGQDSLARMKRAAGIYSGEEKTGCHWIALANPTVIDVEVAIPGTVEKGDAGEEVASPRIDILALERLGDDFARLVFWEAKTFKNPELGRARSKAPAPVLSQIASYGAILDTYRSEIEASYARLCGDLRAIRAAGGRGCDPLIQEVADGKRAITLGETAHVNLLVFGFDARQRADPHWQAHSKGLKDELAKRQSRLRAVGSPRGARLQLS